MWLADPVTQPKAGGCIHGALASVRLRCFGEVSLCPEGVRLFGLILWMCVPQRTEKSRKWHIHHPPSVMAIQAPSPLSWDFSYRGEAQGGQQGWVVTMLILTTTLWKHGEASWEAWERDAKKESVFHSTLALYYASIPCLIVSWHGNEQPS